MTGFSVTSVNQGKEPFVSFRRKETYKSISSVSHGGQVSNPYKCQWSSVASFAGVRLYRSLELMNEHVGQVRAIRSGLLTYDGGKKINS